LNETRWGATRSGGYSDGRMTPTAMPSITSGSRRRSTTIGA
jgi:hypothetical protein